MRDLSEDTKWIPLLLSGDRKVVSDFVDTYGGFIFNVCYKILLDRFSAEEATQDTIMKIINAIQSYDQKSAFKAWCYTIAYRTAIDYKRKIRYSAPITSELDMGSHAGADKNLLDGETQKSILTLLSHLDDESRMIISLYYLEEKNIRELMKITGLTESNIKIKLFRARKELALHAGKCIEH